MTNVLSFVMIMLLTGLYMVEIVSSTCMSSNDHLFTDLSAEA